jgi:hypothetical protein
LEVVQEAVSGVVFQESTAAWEEVSAEIGSAVAV